MAPIPITIITGFLGSGKTTLILNLIPQLRTANPDYRLALLKNEFGDLAVDSQLASSSAISGVQELLGGCICCNLVGQLGDALKELSDSEQPPNRIVVETSGSAFPATLALEVNRVARETGNYVLDGVVSVIDVENWKGYEDTSYTARIQARYTDLVVFNKWEVCSEDRFDECRDRLGDLEVDVAWVKSSKGWVSADLAFGIDGALARSLTEGPGDGHAHGDLDDHGHSHKHDHQTEVEVLSIEVKGPPDSAVDTAQVLALLKAAPRDEVYRIKAVLTLDSGPTNSDDDSGLPTPPHPGGRYILNWAFGRWTFTPVAEDVAEHESSRQTLLRMTMILARYESTKWKKKLEAGGLLGLAGGKEGELAVTKIL
ncbi:related to putative GTPases (G3E family) [Cephalotrichum gorgonifer]|uniref:Related to putative GTPases (G3E family) n=1 Tax=Cephalotrichum gorgonifer TaxID=2041049 RepID=A0AAE8MU80_9PEZI|nr:related to putative GTPases (G3E family) [Cephalotrichum gorgonifer]